MNQSGYEIIDWSSEYESNALELEKSNIQGHLVQLELIKEHFLDRAILFHKHYACLAVQNQSRVLGSAIGARVKLILNGVPFDTGFGFDAKVLPSWRNQGLGRNLAKQLYKKFFRPNNLDKIFMTAKRSNLPVIKLAHHTVKKTWNYPFVYLTIPSATRILSQPNQSGSQLFQVGLFENAPPGSSKEFGSGLGCFFTHKFYTLRIIKINVLYKMGIQLLKVFRPKQFAALPKENDTIDCATLYNHTPGSLSGINEVLEHIQSVNLDYLLVCCRKNDPVYDFLHPYSINTYSYYVVSDFELNKNDRLTVDVRCL